MKNVINGVFFMAENSLRDRLVLLYIQTGMAKDIGNVYGTSNRRNMAALPRIRRRVAAIHRKFKKTPPKDMKSLLGDGAEKPSVDCPPSVLRAAVFFERAKILQCFLLDGGSVDGYQKNTGITDSIMEQLVHDSYESGVRDYHFDEFLGSVDDSPVYKNAVVWNDDRPFFCTARFHEAQSIFKQIQMAQSYEQRQELAKLLPKKYLQIDSVKNLIENGVPEKAI